MKEPAVGLQAKTVGTGRRNWIVLGAEGSLAECVCDITNLLPATKSCISIAGHSLHRHGYSLGPSQYFKG